MSMRYPSGKEALKELRAGQEFSLAILDILMPDMDGLETLGEIRKISKDLPDSHALRLGTDQHHREGHEGRSHGLSCEALRGRGA
ncbi:MAG: response regulator [Desulfosudis oleivorans]|nr:response regulator [Desulfosudis oleivorans]